MLECMNERQHKLLKPVCWIVVFVGLFLFSGMFWEKSLDPLIFDSSGEYRTDEVFKTISPLLCRVAMQLTFGWFYGLPCLFLGAVGLIFVYRSSERFPGFGPVAVSLALLSHLVILLFSVQFFFVPAGSSIRPMAWALLVFMISAGTFLVVEPISLIAIAREEPASVGIWGFILGITPWPFSSNAFAFIC
jgi:hypothetical protein